MLKWHEHGSRTLIKMWFDVKTASNNIANRSRNPFKMLQNWYQRQSWRHLGGTWATIGHSIQKRSRGIVRFGEAFGSPLGPWGTQKPPQPFRTWLFGQPFWTKSRKRDIQKGIPKFVPKKHRKICQEASKIMPKWKHKSVIVHVS